MTIELARKLQLGDRGIRVLNAPATFELEAQRAAPSDEDAAVLVFVRDRTELDALVGPAVAAARADRVAWIAYPKAGQLGTDLNRDSLAAVLRERGLRGVRQIALDDVWSALRFRPA